MNDFENITDFSAKDSTEYESNIALFEEAEARTSETLENYRDTLFNNSEIPTRLPRKTRNSARFLDEDFLTGRKMNSDTNATEELLQEKLMFGSTEADLDDEILAGGVSREVAEIFQQHGITGKAVKQTFKKLGSYYGESPDIEKLATEDISDEEISEDEYAEDELEDTSAETASEEDEEVQESLEEKFYRTNKAFRKLLAERNLKKKYFQRAF